MVLLLPQSKNLGYLNMLKVCIPNTVSSSLDTCHVYTIIVLINTVSMWLHNVQTTYGVSHFTYSCWSNTTTHSALDHWKTSNRANTCDLGPCVHNHLGDQSYFRFRCLRGSGKLQTGGEKVTVKMTSRTEINFTRLLHCCETMAAEKKFADWRLEKVFIPSLWFVLGCPFWAQSPFRWCAGR